MAGWGEEDAEYINMVDNNRVFFECLLEQVFHCTGSHLNTLSQVLAERNKEGLEERSWAEALAPRFDSILFICLDLVPMLPTA